MVIMIKIGREIFYIMFEKRILKSSNKFFLGRFSKYRVVEGRGWGWGEGRMKSFWRYYILIYVKSY